MIPEFPEFKKLELADKDEIESFTKQFPPYSDFNFVSMWSWDIKGDMRVAWLNGNLVVKFTDYLTSQPFYSFLGTNKVNDTAAALIEISKVLGQKASLALVPEIVAQLLDPEEFVVLEEPNHFDYIYELDAIARMEDKRFESKRRSVRQFLENESVYRVLDVDSTEAREAIEAINAVWLKNKLAGNSKVVNVNEFTALERFFKIAEFKDTIATFIFIETTPVGYAIYEKIHNNYIVSHFAKFDITYKGINDYFLYQDSVWLKSQGFSFMNLEQDLGIAGLRSNKKSFSTGVFLKKYNVMLK